MSFKAVKSGNHTISIKPDGNFKYITLIDKLTGVETDMLNNSYTFKVMSIEGNRDRFTVKFSKDIPAENENFAYQSGEELIINAEGHVQIVDIMGRVVYHNDVKNNDRINISMLKTNTYIVRCIGKDNVKTQKFIIL